MESVDEVVRISEPCESGLLIRDAQKCQIESAESNSDESKEEVE